MASKPREGKVNLENLVNREKATANKLWLVNREKARQTVSSKQWQREKVTR